MATPALPHAVRVVDSHTGGEPTRVVLEGGPDLGAGPLAERARLLASEHDRFRSGVACEPRGSDALVGALLTTPHAEGCDAGVVFFNNVGVLGMCGHGAIGLVVTLAHLGQVTAGEVRLDTPVGVVTATLEDDLTTVRIANVASHRLAAGVTVDVPGVGPVTGDVAWGGNWFFLCAADPALPLEPANTRLLTDRALAIRAALEAAGVTGEGGARIDHVELVGPPADPANDARNFVLCPGGAFDRSPCGTGTSAKVACLAADGRLEPGATWRQESVTGSVFEASYARGDGGSVLPTIRGTAHVTAESTLRFDARDPLAGGVTFA